MKRKWIVFGMVMSLVVLALAGVLGKLYYETRQMAPLATQEVAPGIYAVQDDYVNLFSVRGANGYIVIDAGIRADHVRKELRRLQIDPQSVKALFLTHSDADHIGALTLFDKAVVYLPEREEQMINGQTSRFLFLKNNMAHAHESFGDNQVVQVSGLTIKGIATPGHTPGSMCYLVNNTFLFTGDSMSLKNGRVHGFNDIFNMDSKTQQVSLEKLAQLPGVGYIFTAHYGLTDRVQTAFESYTE